MANISFLYLWIIGACSFPAVNAAPHTIGGKLMWLRTYKKTHLTPLFIFCTY